MQLLSQVLSNLLSETTMTAQDGHRAEDLVQVTSVLTLANVKSSDAGVYQCVASNIVATVYSARATITVSGNCHIDCLTLLTDSLLITLVILVVSRSASHMNIHGSHDYSWRYWTYQSHNNTT